MGEGWKCVEGVEKCGGRGKVCDGRGEVCVCVCVDGVRCVCVCGRGGGVWKG